MRKTILITGAAGNLGGAVLKKFMEHDYQVAALVSDRRTNNLKTTANLKIYAVDLLDENKTQQAVNQIVEDFDNIDMAVLTAGGFAMGSLTDTGEEQLNKMYRLNFLTAYHMARQVYMQMLKHGDGGQIIFTGSRPAIHPGSAKDMLSYAFSKSLVFRLAEVINEDGKSSGITASVVVPGIIDTARNRSAMPDADFAAWVSASEIADNIYHLSTTAGRQLRESIIKVYGDSQTGN